MTFMYRKEKKDDAKDMALVQMLKLDYDKARDEVKDNTDPVLQEMFIKFTKSAYGLYKKALSDYMEKLNK